MKRTYQFPFLIFKHSCLIIIFFVFLINSANGQEINTNYCGLSFVNGGGMVVSSITLSLAGQDATGRNRYLFTDPTGGNQIWLEWNTGNSMWELKQGSFVYMASSFASIPNPPDLATGSWSDGCGSGFTGINLDGTGTQTELVLTPTPVELSSFLVQAIDRKAILSWETTNELNNEKFEIEHSTDGTHFSYLANIKGKGTTYEAHAYSYIHLSPAQGFNYYRLKQIDFSGQFSYSNIVNIEFDSFNNTPGINVFPNPSKASIQYRIDRPEEITELQLVDFQGRVLANTHTIDGRFPLYGISPGTYFLIFRGINTYKTQIIVN